MPPVALESVPPQRSDRYQDISRTGTIADPPIVSLRKSSFRIWKFPEILLTLQLVTTNQGALESVIDEA